MEGVSGRLDVRALNKRGCGWPWRCGVPRWPGARRAKRGAGVGRESPRRTHTATRGVRGRDSGGEAPPAEGRRGSAANDAVHEMHRDALRRRVGPKLPRRKTAGTACRNPGREPSGSTRGADRSRRCPPARCTAHGGSDSPRPKGQKMERNRALPASQAERSRSRAVRRITCGEEMTPPENVR
jgi:hypothetical protein